MKELERLASGEAIIELEETPSMCPSDESAMCCEVGMLSLVLVI